MGCMRRLLHCLVAFSSLLGPCLSTYDAFNQHQEALSIITHHVPIDVRQHLGWTSRDAIMAALCKPRWLQWVELFCGTGTLSLHLERELTRGMSMDTAVGGASHNILSAQGFANALLAILALVPYGFCWLAPPCALWVFLSAGVHKRTCLRPSGDTSRLDVRECNAIVDRCCILIRLMTCRLIQWILEQPLTSTLFRYCSFMVVRQKCQRIFGCKLQR